MKKVMFVMMLVAIASMSFASPIAIVNGDFELDGVDNASPPAGWTDTSSAPSWWTGVVGEASNPTLEEAALAPAPGLGSFILTTARDSAGVADQPIDGQLVQTVDLTSFATDIDAGGQNLYVDFIWASDDYRDTGDFTLRLYDGSAIEVATYSVLMDDVDGYNFVGWFEETVGGAVPVGTRSVLLEINSTRTGGSATNIWIDNISGNLVPEPATLALLGLGGLVLRRRK